MAETPQSRTPSAAPAPLATSLSLLLPLGVVVAFLLLVGGVATAFVRWCLYDEAGSRWLLGHVPGVQVQGFEGALLGPQWRAERVHVAWDSGRASVTLEGLAADGLQWAWRPDDHAWLALQVQALALRRITVVSGPPSSTAPAAPRSLALPLHLALANAKVDELRVDQLAPVQALALQGLLLRAEPGAEHRIDSASATWQGVLAEASGRIGNSAPLTVVLQARLRPVLDGDAPRWAAVLAAQGPLAQPALTGTLRGVPRPGLAPPAIDLATVLRPFQPWPLDKLDLATEELDLSALSTQAPQTRLNGTATLAPRVPGAPLAAVVELVNALPGRWNERRLPIVRLAAELRGSLEQPDRVEAPRFELSLADATGAAGRWSGRALWQGHELTLDTRLAELVPQRLDSRAAAMRLAGPVQATLRGLPSPTGTAAPGGGPVVEWKLDLEGALDASPQPVRLAMEGRATDRRLEIAQLRASSGGASAELRAMLQQQGQRNEWRLETAGSLVDFDPVPWYPGEAGSAWRQGPHRFSAGWQADVRLPGNAAQLHTLELLQRLAGNGSLRLHDSMLAGVPLAADIRLGYTQAAAPTTVQLRAELQMGGNRLTVDGRGDPGSSGEADRWRAELQAETLTTLAPLARLHPALADWVPRQGSGSAEIAADGRWPSLRTEGQARLAQLRMGDIAVTEGQASWRLATGGDRPLSARVVLAGLQWGPPEARQGADHLTAELSGTLADHRIEIGGALPLQPPQALVQALGVQAQTGTRAQLLAQGQWQPDPAGGGRWRARVERLLLGSWDGSAPGAGGSFTAPPTSVWAQARELRAQLQFGPGGSLQALQADAGRVLLGDQVALRWDEVQADWRGERATMTLRADIEPFPLAPLLARAQPGMGWAGDLRLAARLDIRAAEKFDADVVFERRDGDLHVGAADGMQLLGLTEVRLALTAHEGQWLFRPQLKGRLLGEVDGSVRVATTPLQRWPQADAPLSGEVRARVADVGIWGAWVPPGWRLAGELSTVATLSGRFGEPRYSGELTGQGLALRNLLQGVNVAEGELRARLQGDRAVIERLRFKGGEGFAELTGEASLGRSPRVQLQLKTERFRVLGRVDRQATASGSARFTLTDERGVLDGRFTLDEGLFDASSADAPSLDSDVSVRGAGQPEPEAGEAKPQAQRRNFVLDVEIDAGPRLRVKGRGVDTRLAGSLRVTNPSGRTAVRGTITAEDGTYQAYGQKLDIERGIVAFSGPLEDPRLDILAVRPNIDARVGVAITGTAQAPRVRLFSDPDMSESDKLSWLLLGRASEGLGRNDTALLQRAAVALLSGEGEAPTDTLLRNLGIDELSVKPGEGDVRETVISLGKQLSRRWYVGYERGVNSTSGTFQLIYRIAQRFTLRAQSGLENSLDVIWSWRVQETPADAGMRKSIVTPP
jgi:translocation and assembly module TamB